MLDVVLNELNDYSAQKRHLVNTFGRPDLLPPKQPAESGRNGMQDRGKRRREEQGGGGQHGLVQVESEALEQCEDGKEDRADKNRARDVPDWPVFHVHIPLVAGLVI